MQWCNRVAKERSKDDDDDDDDDSVNIPLNQKHDILA